jgi:hypothetical protein
MKSLLLLLIFIGVNQSFGFSLHAVEIGVGKFHRASNKSHPYGESNAWAPYVLPEGDSKTPIVVTNKDKSVSIFFSTLEELVTKTIEVANQRGEQVTVLNINGHGLPGAMWYPQNESFKKSFECWQWNEEASGADEGNVDHYYSAIKKQDIMDMRDYSQTGGRVPCTSNAASWKAVIKSHPEFKTAISSELTVNFLSCIVGLGPVGEKFLQDLAVNLGAGNGLKLRASMHFGLGDWSMPEGMGFWDYQTDEQLEHDNSVYPVNKRDSEIAQKGTIRTVRYQNSSWVSVMSDNNSFLTLENVSRFIDGLFTAKSELKSGVTRPTALRIPGTRVYENVN